MPKKQSSTSSPAVKNSATGKWMGNKLLFPSLSITFIQTFFLDRNLEFRCPDSDPMIRLAELGDIDRIWFDGDFAPEYLLKGFDFHLALDSAPLGNWTPEFNGHCDVRMNLFFGRTASVTYRFLFDGEACSSTSVADTDAVIEFLCQYLNDSDTLEASTNDEADVWGANRLKILSPIDSDGNPVSGLDETVTVNHESGFSNGLFSKVSARYKKFLLGHCTRFKKGTPRSVQNAVGSRDVSSRNDLRYALVDIWESIQNPHDGKDFFLNLSSNEIIDHVMADHRKELIGMMSLCPEDWIFHSEDAFDSVCGGDLTLDTDEILLVGNKLSVNIGTYGRRAYLQQSVEWKDLYMGRRLSYGVSCPEYLLMLQFRLAQKCVLQTASRVLLHNTVAPRASISQRLASNQDDSFFLSTSMLQFDAAETVRVSDRLLLDGMASRLDVASDRQAFEHNMEVINDVLRNIKDGQTSSREVTMNVILGIVSVISAFQLFFVGTRMPFLSDFWHIESGTIGALIITIVAAISIFVVLVLIVSAVKGFIRKR